MNEKGVKSIALDLDGTLAEYEGWKGVSHIGKPIEKMVTRLIDWLALGYDVEIFTARVSVPSEAPDAEYYILKWLRDNGLPQLEITCVKKKKFDEFWDDRAVRIIKNTGKIQNEY